MRNLLLGLLLLVGLLITQLITPLQATAQQILGAILPADLPRYQQVHDAMTAILRSGGFTEEKLKIFVQKPNPDKMSLINSVRRCQAAGATLVVTYGSFAAQLASNELRDIPLLFADVYDPVASGIVKTLEAPGTNATGAASKTDLGLLVSTLVNFKSLQKVGVIYTKGEPGSELQLADLQAFAGKQGFKISAQPARNPQEALKLAQELAGTCDALYLTECLAVAQKDKEITQAVQAQNTPIFSQVPGLVAAGALIGLEADPAEQGKLVAVHALQILQGQKAYILPVRPARSIALKVNTTTAAALNISISPEVKAAVQIIP